MKADEIFCSSEGRGKFILQFGAKRVLCPQHPRVASLTAGEQGRDMAQLCAGDKGQPSSILRADSLAHSSFPPSAVNHLPC